MSGCASCKALTPSGAATKQTKRILDAPRFFNESIAIIAEPPVANIGSTTNN